jgi:hypothetical protein
VLDSRHAIGLLPHRVDTHDVVVVLLVVVLPDVLEVLAVVETLELLKLDELVLDGAAVLVVVVTPDVTITAESVLLKTSIRL